MYRLMPHSTSDDDSIYRSAEEVQAQRAKDPLPKMFTYLLEAGIWSESAEQELIQQVTKELNEATEFADRAPYPTPENTLKHVYEGD